MTFPLFEKIEVNGEGRHPIYAELEESTDAEGTPATSAGTSRSSSSGPPATSARFSPMVTPEDPDLVEAIEGALPA